MSTAIPTTTYPDNWLIGRDFDPNGHMMQLKGKDYLPVQGRLLWFIRDQRALIAAGLATTTYVVRTELVEQDRNAGWAHFKTYVRDVMGNETTMYGSESVKDFPDYAEKASTKALGRALLCLGYGAGSALELDEGERIVDAPVERRTAAPAARPTPTAVPATPPRPTSQRSPALASAPASAEQLAEIEWLCDTLGMDPPHITTHVQAELTIKALKAKVDRIPAAASATATTATAAGGRG